jgi:hypothetical protein
MNNGGVAILAKSSIKCDKICDIDKFIIEEDFESVGVTISISNKINIVILTIYRTPKSNFNNFIINLNLTLDKLLNKYTNSKFIVVGDFNIDFFNINSNNFKNITDTFLTFGMERTIYDPARVTRHSSTCIDNIFTNINCNEYYAKTVNMCMSDHFGQQISIIHSATQQNISHRYRATGQQNLNELNYLLSKESWNSFALSEYDVNASWDNFITILKHHINTSCPKINVKKPKTSNNKKQWITKGIIKSSNTVKNLYNLTTNFGSDINLINHYNKYKSIYRSIVRLAKKRYNSNLIENATNRSKTVWNVINKTIKSAETNVIDKIEINDSVVQDPNKIANSFNNYFIKISQILTSNIEPSLNINNSKIKLKFHNNSLYLEPIDENEIVNIVQLLKNTSSAGTDEITSKIVKSCLPYILKPLQYLINLSFEQGIFPNILKTSIVKPIYKKGDKKKLENYRPISLLSVFSKILEKAIANRIYVFFEKFELLNPYQFGYRKKLNTIDMLLLLL